VPAARDREARLPERSRAGGGRVLEVLDGKAGQSELLHGPDAAHNWREDVADVRRLHVAEREPGVLQGGEPGVAAHVGVRDGGPHPEPVHPDAEDGDVLHRSAPTGRKRTMTISRPSSSRSGSSSGSRVMPTRYSSCLPASGSWTRGPSGRSTCPTP